MIWLPHQLRYSNQRPSGNNDRILTCRPTHHLRQIIRGDCECSKFCSWDAHIWGHCRGQSICSAVTDRYHGRGTYVVHHSPPGSKVSICVFSAAAYSVHPVKSRSHEAAKRFHSPEARARASRRKTCILGRTCDLHTHRVWGRNQIHNFGGVKPPKTANLWISSKGFFKYTFVKSWSEVSELVDKWSGKINESVWITRQMPYYNDNLLRCGSSQDHAVCNLTL